MFVIPRGFVYFPVQGDIISFSFPQEKAKQTNKQKTQQKKTNKNP